MSPLAVGSAQHFPWSEREGHSGVGTGKGLGAGARGGGMSVAAADERLRWPWGNWGAQSQWTNTPGWAPRLAQSHPPWVRHCRRHQGERGGEGGHRSLPPSQAWFWAAAPSAKPSRPDWAGLGPGCCGQHRLWSPFAFASIQAPTIIYSIVSPPRHVVPSQTEMGRRHHRDKTEGGFNYSVFQSPQTYSGAKRTIYLVNKRNRRGKLLFALILMFMGESLTGTPHMGTVVSLHQASVNEHRFSNPGQNAG